LAAGSANNIVAGPSSTTEAAAAQMQGSAAVIPDQDSSPTAWELLRFTLPTLAVWIINPMLG
jgi:hypothetical protein